MAETNHAPIIEAIRNWQSAQASAATETAAFQDKQERFNDALALLKEVIDTAGDKLLEAKRQVTQARKELAAQMAAAGLSEIWFDGHVYMVPSGAPLAEMRGCEALRDAA